VELSTKVRRRVSLVGLVLCVVGGAVVPGAQADRRPQQKPEELWRAYPLEQTPTTSAPAPASPAQRSGTPTDTSTSDPSWVLLAGVAAASAMLVFAALTLRRRRRADDVPGGTGPLVPGPILPPAIAPLMRTTPTAAARVNGRPAGRSKGPVCQIRWSRRGRWFYAVRIDPDGVEHRIGRSSRVDCDGPGPPGETPEARAALRQLVKDLRQGGWRPLRARGIDFEERRWYARRFRWPTEAEVLAGNPDASERPQEVAGRPGGER
jgi:hypothetical protein